MCRTIAATFGLLGTTNARVALGSEESEDTEVLGVGRSCDRAE
jgi:hypothetical protein